MTALVYFVLAALLLLLASLGRFLSMVLLPWIAGPLLALSGGLRLAFKRRSMSRTQLALTAAGCVLAALAPVGQLTHIRVTQNAWRKEALATFQTTGKPPLLFAHVLNDRRQTFRNQSTFRGVTVLNFWATWCSPCRKEMPMLETFARNHDASAVRIVGFTRFYDAKNEAERPAELERIEQALRRLGVSYPTLVGVDGRTHAAYRVHALPTTVLIGADGRIAAYEVGIDGTKRLLKMADDLAAKTR